MLLSPANANTKQTVDALLTDQTPEGRSLDYKRDLKLSNDQDKRELVKDVSALANAGGGFLVFGIDEAKDSDGKGLGYPEKILGVDCPNFDATKLRIDSIVRDNLDPRVQGVSIHSVDGYDRGPVIIVHVPKSWTGPHMVSIHGQTHFYSRTNAGNHPLDVREIRSAFLTGSDVARRIQSFRDSRIGQIVADEAAVPLVAGPRLVVHVIPVASDLQPELARLSDGLSPMAFTAGGFNTRYSLDGFVAFTGSDKQAAYSYSLAFRDGAFEGITLVNARTDISPPAIYGTGIEADALSGVRQFVRSSRASGYTGPLSVLITLIGGKGKWLIVNEHRYSFSKYTIDRDVLLLPDVLIETDSNIVSALKPAFDALWQASGYPKSPGYTDAGEWDAAVHPR
jgi:hypothetical protein